MEIRPVHPDEYERLGGITVAAYHALPGHVHEPEYDVELADISAKVAAGCEVMVAIPDGAAELVGGVCFVPDHDNPFHEGDDPGSVTFRHLAVDPAAQGAGAGTALVQWCIDRARTLGAERVFIHSTPWMTGAHRMYERFGFRRTPEHDWLPVPDVPLWAFVLDLDQPPAR